MTPSTIPGLLRCNSCAFQTADIDIGAEELAVLYTHKYFNGHEYANYVADRQAIEKSFLRRFDVLLKHVSAPKHKALFEVGCAYGFFLNLAKDRFGRASGIDISCDAVQFARSALGVDAVCGDLLEHALPEPIDVACLWDTIEHLSEPHRYIERLAKAMPRGGLIAITTGDIDSAVARWRGKKWRQIHPPTHLQYFSRKTLTALLERHGFTIRYVGFDGMYRSIESMSYIIFALKRRQEAIHNGLKTLGLLRGNLYLNLHDIIYVVAEKSV